jgi:hypothetical protein
MTLDELSSRLVQRLVLFTMARLMSVSRSMAEVRSPFMASLPPLWRRTREVRVGDSPYRSHTLNKV